MSKGTQAVSLCSSHDHTTSRLCLSLLPAACDFPPLASSLHGCTCLYISLSPQKEKSSQLSRHPEEPILKMKHIVDRRFTRTLVLLNLWGIKESRHILPGHSLQRFWIHRSSGDPRTLLYNHSISPRKSLSLDHLYSHCLQTLLFSLLFCHFPALYSLT